MGDDMDAMMADGLLRTVRDAAKLLYGENQTYPCDDVKRMMADVERLRAALELYRDAVRIDATMEGPKFMGANSSALKRAWDADRAALEGRT